MELTFTSSQEEDTARLGRMLAACLRAGDCVLMTGTLGAGKSALCRSIIRTLTDDDTRDVPSPTFTLIQSYETAKGDACHIDLYRLDDPQECYNLGLEDIMGHAITLVEWPDRLPPDLQPADALHLSMQVADSGARTIQMTGGARWAGITLDP